MEKITEPGNSYLLSQKAFFLELPFYLEVDLTVTGVAQRVFQLVNYYGTVDAYCIYCDKESVFDTEDRLSESPTLGVWGRTAGFMRSVHRCSRNATHKYYGYFLKSNTALQKVGQFPSAADFQIPQAEKYRKVLGETQYKELTRGIGLVAHGVGIGSFVYLRRVFENLIEEAHKTASAVSGWDEAVYKSARMDEKIRLLEAYLPEFLVENRNLYSVMSKGVHELKEEECLEYFEAVRIGIEQILDEKKEKKEKEEKAERARKAVQDVSQKVS